MILICLVVGHWVFESLKIWISTYLLFYVNIFQTIPDLISWFLAFTLKVLLKGGDLEIKKGRTKENWVVHWYVKKKKLLCNFLLITHLTCLFVISITKTINDQQKRNPPYSIYFTAQNRYDELFSLRLTHYNWRKWQARYQCSLPRLIG